MQPSSKEPSEDRARWFRYLGFAMSVPMILLSGPLIGLVFGMWLDQRFHVSPWFTVGGVVIGLLSSGREVFTLIRRIDQESKSERKKIS